MRAEYVKEYEHLEKRHWWWRARRRIVASALLESLKQNPGKNKLLDIGCGAGVNLAEFKRWFDCRGIEPDRALAEAARRNSGVSIAGGRLPGGLPPLSERFDYVLLLDVLEHIEDAEAALREAVGLLADGGRVVINVPALPALWSIHDVVNEHKRRYRRQELKDLLVRCGLAPLSLSYWGAFLVPPAYAARKLLGPGRTEDYRVEIPPAPINAAIESLVVAEHRLLRGAGLPFGLSLLSVNAKIAR